VLRAPNADPGVVAFLGNAQRMLLDSMGVVAQIGQVSARRIRVEDRIAVIIHVRGDLTGLTWLFPHALAARAAHTLAPSFPVDAEMLQLAASELANILTGRCADALAAHGIHIEIEPPQVAAVTPSGMAGTLETELGPIEIIFHGLGRIS
jgi:CheY-specific phosphatase CheX